MASALPAAESSTPKLFLVGKGDHPVRRLELPANSHPKMENLPRKKQSMTKMKKE